MKDMKTAVTTVLRMRVKSVRASVKLLTEIDEEAADLLRGKPISPKVIHLLKLVSPGRQIEIVDMIVSANRFGTGCTEALVLATPRDQLARPGQIRDKRKNPNRLNGKTR